jgi:hypothetical protein
MIWMFSFLYPDEAAEEHVKQAIWLLGEEKK